MIQVKEVLRWWLRDDGGVRWIAAGDGVDRETARRYIEAAVGVGLEGDGGEDQLSDALIGAVCEAVRPARPTATGSRGSCCAPMKRRSRGGWTRATAEVAKGGTRRLSFNEPTDWIDFAGG